MLAELGLDRPLFEPKAKRIQKSKQPKKRKVPEVTESTENESDSEAPARKLQRVDSDTSASSPVPEGPRRSARNIGKALDYNKEREVKPLAFAAPESLENTGPMGRQEGQRIHNPYASYARLSCIYQTGILPAKHLVIFRVLQLEHGGA